MILSLLFVFTSLFSTVQVGAQETIEVRFDPDVEYQTIANFGASDAWTIQEVGKWPDENREYIAELLFSLEMDENQSPRGIGLSCWRFNIGAGSAEQGENSNIIDPWRRAECFVDSEGDYDWSKQSGQQWFLKEAVGYQVQDLVAFVNSPPVHFTKNGKAYSEDGKGSNLKSEHYADFADFLSEVVSYFDNQGIVLDYLSPFNEPQWDWKCCKQEGSPWTNEEVSRLTRILDARLQDSETDCQIEIPESAQIDFMIGGTERFPQRGNQVDEFFNPDSKNYLGSLPMIAKKVSGHSYFSTWDNHRLISLRQELRDKLDNYPDLNFWMSEYCILENNKLIKGGGKDLGMDPALYVANVIHADLTIANASAWHWWLAVSKYDYKDGLIYVGETPDSEVEPSKLLWALGNYSRFVRPGMKRVKAETSSEKVLLSAFKDAHQLVLVIANPLDHDFQVSLPDRFTIEEGYVTDETHDLERMGEEAKIISARSITTLLLTKD